MVEFGSRGMFPTDMTDARGIQHIVGNAELAARLGSIVTYDRRGDVIFMDNFEEPVLKWFGITSGAGSSVNMSTAYARTGGNSVALKVAACVDCYAAIYKYLPLPIENKLGVETSFTIPSDIDRIGIEFIAYTGSKKHESGLFYSRTEEVLYIFGELGGSQTIATNIKPFPSDHLFHTLKFVIDYKNEKYLRALFDDKEYDISDLGCYSEPSGVGSSSIIILWAVSNAVGSPITYVDDVIFTQNEPYNKVEVV